jgi:hypothetical protein
MDMSRNTALQRITITVRNFGENGLVLRGQVPPVVDQAFGSEALLEERAESWIRRNIHKDFEDNLKQVGIKEVEREDVVSIPGASAYNIEYERM